MRCALFRPQHFKAEQAARQKAEELLQEAIAGEMEARERLEDSMKRRAALEGEKNMVKKVRRGVGAISKLAPLFMLQCTVNSLNHVMR